MSLRRPPTNSSFDGTTIRPITATKPNAGNGAGMDPILTATLINSGLNFLGGAMGGEDNARTAFTGNASPQNYMSILNKILGSEYARMNAQRGQGPQLRSSYLPDPTTGKLEGAPTGIPANSGPIDLSFMDRLMPSSAQRRGIPADDNYPAQPSSKQAEIIRRRRAR